MPSRTHDTLRAAEVRAYLQQHEDALQLIADAVPALVAFIDARGRYAFVNEAYSEWFGLPQEQILGRTVREVVGRSAYERIGPDIRAALAGERVEFQKEIPYSKAGRRVVHSTYVPRFGAEGDVLGFVAVVIDVTQRTEAAERLRAGFAAQKRLEEEQRTLYDLSRELSTSAAPCDVARVVVSRARSVLGSTVAVVYGVAKGERAAHLVAWEGGPSSPRPVLALEAAFPLATAIRSKRPLWITDPRLLRSAYPDFSGQAGVPVEQVKALAAVPLLSCGSAIGGLAFAFAEAHGLPPPERKFVLAVAELCANAFARARILEAERHLREQRERDAAQLASEAELRERFVGVLGHDLKNPLAAIVTTARTLERRAALPSEERPTVERVARCADRMGRMIDELLDFTRIRHCGGLPLSPGPAELDTLAEEILAELRAARPGITLRCEARGDCRGEWDADRLSAVVSNLAGNAMRYGERGAPVVVRVDGTGAGVVLEVENQGAPIAPDELAVIFEPFRTGSGHPAKEGLGLGLYITREIVVAHGGAISVDSQGGRTVFTVELPRKMPPGSHAMLPTNGALLPDGERPAEAAQPTDGTRSAEAAQPTDGTQSAEAAQPTEGAGPAGEGRSTNGHCPR
jgi:PAS domain S-box-containing protein